MPRDHKNVVSVQTAGGTYTFSGFTANTSASAQTITKHSAFIIQGTTSGFSVVPVYYNTNSDSITGATLGVFTSVNVPIYVPARMKSFTGLTGGSITFLA